MLTYSFPCQDLSQQGKQKGLAQNTRSGLLYQIERILEANKNNLPKVLVLENVKALTTSKFINSFEDWIKTLETFGYKTKWSVMNSKDYNSAQNRERVFAVSFLGENNFEFPKINSKPKTIKEVIKQSINDNNVDLSHMLNKYKTSSFTKSNNNIIKSKLLDYTSFNSEAYIYDLDGLGPTLTATGANSRIKIYDKKSQKLFSMNSLDTYLYMGFKLEDALKVKETNLISDTKMIFTCGNSIHVNVLEELFKEIIKCMK
nr:DNA (cytosine-5-)-methyltransferase [Mycoplasma crocodyli]